MTVLPYSCLNSLNSLPSTTLAMISRTSYVRRGSTGMIASSSAGGYSGGRSDLTYTQLRVAQRTYRCVS
jgi:hypothetical protein